MMPYIDQFKNQDSYNATLFHELTHWTGHHTRLNRKLRNRFGDAAYAFEELIAELGSAFQCARFDITGEQRHAAYIDTWLQVLKQDKRAVFTAATRAKNAVEYLHAQDRATDAAAA